MTTHEVEANIETSIQGQPILAGAHDGATLALPELEAFVDKVLCDGRYVHTFQDNPLEVADRLGVVLSPELARQLSSTPRAELVARLWNTKLRAAKTGPEKNLVFPEAMSPDVGVLIFVVILVFAVVVYIVVRRKGGKVHDNSLHKSAKL